MPNTRPGIKTSEFWLTALTGVLAGATDVCAGLGVAFDGTKFQALIPVAATIAAGIAAHGFSGSRAVVKQELLAAQSNLEQNLLLTTPPPAPPTSPPTSTNLDIALSQLTDTA